ncbi:hypothetical protein F1C58_15945 [Glaciihabitans sp. INWT7]|uniref:hypothetical protein n=1 Tax=Glaciihabitans sp. INWT7 TaxID=2596912 RepID=UPI001625F356|nr:hypothetical protein [Glaciihabitans sp. INWT7]QNE48243.1 hypothetical protein F1C58_15945 [Glaciihabitans sp. INWT7]
MTIGTIGTIGTVGDSGVDVALHRQLVALDAVAGRIAHARSALPSAAGDGVWSGDARRMYVRGLQHLAVQVQSAEAHVDEAIRNTRRAIAALDDGSHGR